MLITASTSSGSHKGRYDEVAASYRADFDGKGKALLSKIAQKFCETLAATKRRIYVDSNGLPSLYQERRDFPSGPDI